jgi:sugar lactone lactonase YvrE
MIGALTRPLTRSLQALSDRLLGRGEAAITVPVFDGALKSNRLLEDAAVFATLQAPEDLATDGQSLFVADGPRVLRYDTTAACAGEAPVGAAEGSPVELQHFDQPVTALACLPGGGLAVALGGQTVRVLGGPHDGRQWDRVDGRPLHAVNALSATADGRLLATDGSREHRPARWKHDLMTLGRSGRVLELALAGGGSRELAGGLAHAFGTCSAEDAAQGGGTVWVSESWRHRVVALDAMGRAGKPRAVTEALPGYPSRLSPATGGGAWLTCFILRTQLVEFVLREPGFRRRMVEEIDPAYWIAPALNSGNTFLEPMQGAQLKMMGIVKPWAPPRSYGLVIRLDAQGRILHSLHSRFDGKNHGVVAAVECGHHLYVLAKGSRRLLRLPLAEIASGPQA